MRERQALQMAEKSFDEQFLESFGNQNNSIITAPLMGWPTETTFVTKANAIETLLGVKLKQSSNLDDDLIFQTEAFKNIFGLLSVLEKHFSSTPTNASFNISKEMTEALAKLATYMNLSNQNSFALISNIYPCLCPSQYDLGEARSELYNTISHFSALFKLLQLFGNNFSSKFSELFSLVP